MKRKLYSALLNLSTLPEFNKSLLRLLHKLVSKESLNTARILRGREEKLTRKVLESYDINKRFSNLVEESPILMTVLHGASCKQKLHNIQVI